MSTMNFIDIASWQAGMNLDMMFKKNPQLDGVIVKTTGGAHYVNPYADSWIQWLREHNKPWGFYHYLTEDGIKITAKQEADFFLANAGNYFGEGVPWLDYEDKTALTLGPGFVHEVLDEIYQRTGIKTGVYFSWGLKEWQDFSAIAKDGYPFWCARYANEKFTSWQTNPWQNFSASPWDKMTILQYSSKGRIPGWGGNLDLDLFYGDKSKWDELAHKAGAEPVIVVPGVPETPKKSVEEIAREVIADKWGIDEDRKKRLTEAGYNYDEVQSMVNKLLGEQKANEIHKMALDVIAGKYGNGLVRMIKLGSMYKAVQNEVNRILSGR